MKQYIIVSLNHSEKDCAVFWRADAMGYTTNPWQAGIYSEEQVKGNPDYFNDGFNTVALCVTNSSFPSAGLKIIPDVKKLKAYRANDKGQIKS